MEFSERYTNLTQSCGTAENISAKYIIIAIISQTIIIQDLELVRNKFNFSDADMDSVPLNPLTHLRETFIDTAFRASQYKMFNKLPKCMNGGQNCLSRICVRAIANRLAMGPGM